MIWRKRDSVATAEPPAPPKAPPHYRVQPRFLIFGPELVTDDDGYVDVDISWVPSGVTQIQLQSGNGFVIYPVDIDGLRVRNPDVRTVRLRWTME